MNEKTISFLRCPVCQGEMRLFSGSPDRVACEKGHSYDVSRWINFLTHPVTEHYDRALFQARREIWDAGMFDPLAEHLARYLEAGMALLDAGCGEGSPLIHTLAYMRDWRKQTAAVGVSSAISSPSSATLPQKQIEAIGVDLAKDGIRLAAGREKDIDWLVCDLTHLPLRNGCMDLVFNILSPACYEEFSRVLKPDGLLVKAVPEEGYLKEIRELLPEKSRALLTPRDALTDRLGLHFELLSSERLTVRRQVPADKRIQLIRMTPLCAHFKDEECTELAGQLGESITIDLTVLTAKCIIK